MFSKYSAAAVELTLEWRMFFLSGQMYLLEGWHRGRCRRSLFHGGGGGSSAEVRLKDHAAIYLVSMSWPTTPFILSLSSYSHSSTLLSCAMTRVLAEFGAGSFSF